MIVIRFFILLLSSNGLVFILSFLFYGHISFLSMINITFYLASGTLLVWLSFITLKSGFFDQISYSFRKVFDSLNKQKDHVDDSLNKHLSSSFQSNFSTLRTLGLSLLIEMLILLLIYYM
ncbi:hypothetical protein ASG46_11485 [Bacillus sp. Leaf49]|nr:hypothetical protein BS467_18235 [Bacillus altitudinis]KQU10886.1 hypothetical protein ASG46_11485 [Bacillus sp. Leaf49]MBR0630793.1 DUF3899 domain-containing protein [Bacillus altitudinis C101]NQW95922.1 DUF3899 domain-containing protein [Bacillus stratosphericus]RFB46793.1 DUF3899 domain-containing protein [Bacillus sp. HMG]